MKEKGLVEYSTVDEVKREAERMAKQEEEIQAKKGPDKRFVECYNKAVAQHPLR